MIKFSKLQGTGNDFIVIDTLAEQVPPSDLPSFSRRVNDRRLGIGGDGIILVERGESAPFRMRMFNPDGSESEMCGNGLRCFARVVHDRGYAPSDHLQVETGAGVLEVDCLAEHQFRVDMGLAHLTRGEIGMTGPADETFIDAVFDTYKGTAVSMGNPHVVIFVEDVDAVDLKFEGPRLEVNPLFPQRTNVHFVQVLDRTHLKQRTWERGAGATMACGTGACSVGVAGFLTGRSERKVEIQLPGGQLDVEYLESGHVLMTGPAEVVFEGSY